MTILLSFYGLLKKTLCRLLLALLIAGSGYHLAFAATLVDQDGQTLPYGVPFKRIISLYPAHTENLLGLGLDQELIGIAAGDEAPVLLGRAQFSANDTPEKFIAAKPDLILIRPMISQAHPQLVNQLKEAGIAIVSLQPTTIDEMFSYWQTLGELTGRAGESAAMIQRFKSELTVIQQDRDRVPVDKRPRVYFESIHAKMKTFPLHPLQCLFWRVLAGLMLPPMLRPGTPPILLPTARNVFCPVPPRLTSILPSKAR